MKNRDGTKRVLISAVLAGDRPVLAFAADLALTEVVDPPGGINYSPSDKRDHRIIPHIHDHCSSRGVTTVVDKMSSPMFGLRDVKNDRKEMHGLRILETITFGGTPEAVYVNCIR